MSIEFYSVGLLLPRVSCKDSDRKYTYGFDFYSQAIANRQFHLVKHPTSIWFNFEDDNPDDNLIYNGIGVSSRVGEDGNKWKYFERNR